MIRGDGPRRIEYIMSKLHQQFRFPPGGTGLAVISAIDHALWDISGKAAGLPVYLLLGGAPRNRIRVYHGIGGRHAQEVAEQAHKLHEDCGFTAFKRSPYSSLDSDANRWGRICAAAADYFEDLRQATPEDWEFAFDAHAKIFEPMRSLQLANALAPYDPYFYEEPLRPEHIPDWSQLRSQMQVPLSQRANAYTPVLNFSTSSLRRVLILFSRTSASLVDCSKCGKLPLWQKRTMSPSLHTIQWDRLPLP